MLFPVVCVQVWLKVSPQDLLRLGSMLVEAGFLVNVSQTSLIRRGIDARYSSRNGQWFAVLRHEG